MQDSNCICIDNFIINIMVHFNYKVIIFSKLKMRQGLSIRNTSREYFFHLTIDVASVHMTLDELDHILFLKAQLYIKIKDIERFA